MDELDRLIDWYRSAAEFAEHEGWDAKRWTVTVRLLEELKERRGKDVQQAV